MCASLLGAAVLLSVLLLFGFLLSVVATICEP